MRCATRGRQNGRAQIKCCVQLRTATAVRNKTTKSPAHNPSNNSSPSRHGLPSSSSPPELYGVPATGSLAAPESRIMAGISTFLKHNMLLRDLLGRGSLMVGTQASKRGEKPLPLECLAGQEAPAATKIPTEAVTTIGLCRQWSPMTEPNLPLSRQCPRSRRREMRLSAAEPFVSRHA